MAAADFSNMKRADEPLDEEVSGLRIACVTLGVLVIGPLFLSSSLLGLFAGWFAATYLIGASGTTGLWAREIGAQVHEMLSTLRSMAEDRDIPGMLATAKSTCGNLYTTCATELASFEKSVGLRTKCLALVTPLWERLIALCEERGLTEKLSMLMERLQRLLAASGIQERLARMEANIEKRRRGKAR
jgi:hypothetical protein